MITIKDYKQFIEAINNKDIYDYILLILAEKSKKFENDFELDTVDGDIESLYELHKIYRNLIRKRPTILDNYYDLWYNKTSSHYKEKQYDGTTKRET